MISVISYRFDRFTKPPLNLDILRDFLCHFQTQVDLATAIGNKSECVPPVPGLLLIVLTANILKLVQGRRAEWDPDPHLEGGSLDDVVADDPGEVGVDGTGERDHDGGQPQVRGVPQLLQQSGLGVLSDVRNVAVHVNGLAGPAHHQAAPVTAG